MLNNSKQKFPMQILIEKFLRSEHSHQYNLNAYHRILMVILASYMGNKETCYPSLKSLVNDCGMSKDTVIRTSKYLENSKIISIKRIKEKNNVYSFTKEVVAISYHLVAVSHQVVAVRHHKVVAISDPNNNNINNNINNHSYFSEKNREGSQKHIKDIIKNLKKSV